MVKFLRFAGGLIALIALIAGFSAGKDVGEALSSISYDDEGFGWRIAFIYWSTGLFASMVLFALSAIVEHLKYLSDRAYDMHGGLSSVEQSARILAERE